MIIDQNSVPFHLSMNLFYLFKVIKERRGFEPLVQNIVRQISNLKLSTTQPPLQLRHTADSNSIYNKIAIVTIKKEMNNPIRTISIIRSGCSSLYKASCIITPVLSTLGSRKITSEIIVIHIKDHIIKFFNILIHL